MTPVHQTIFDNISGNCLQACVASVLDLPIEKVPNFMLAPGVEWYDTFVDYMRGRGFYPIYLHPDVIERDGTRPYGYHLLQGKSPRGDYDHVIVGLNGKPVHGPHPDGGMLDELRYIIVFAALL